MSELEPADLALLEDLQVLWERADPAPGDLADKMIAAIAVADLEREIELMLLVGADDTPSGVRGSGPLTSMQLEFALDDTAWVLSVASSGAKRRVDGWIAPATPGSIWVIRDASTRQGPTEVTDGRFALPDVAPGLLQLCFMPDDPAAAAVVTPRFEI